MATRKGKVTTQKKQAIKAPTPIAIRLPKEVVAKLDKQADKNFRSRSAEIKSRLVASLAVKGKT